MRKVAFVFPGQGSQSVGMLADLVDHPSVLTAITQASQSIDVDLQGLMTQGPSEALGLTTNTQPVMLAVGIAFYEAYLNAGGVVPDVVAGHSLGEYTALTVAGALRLQDAVPLVRFRAQVMQDAVPVGVGAMAAILNLPAPQVQQVCEEASANVAPNAVQAVNFNSPEQTVIAGHKNAVDVACELALAVGAKRALLLPVSAPFHSALMLPAAARLSEYLVNVEMCAPTIDVINNVDVAIVHDPSEIKQALVRQAAGAVRWVETIQKMVALGVTDIVECGSGKVLGGLIKRIDKSIKVHHVCDRASLQSTVEALQ